MKKNVYPHSGKRYAVLTGLFAILLVICGFAAIFVADSFGDVFLTPSAKDFLTENPAINQDTRFLKLLHDGRTGGIYILGSFPAYGYDAGNLSEQTGKFAYNLSAPSNDFAFTKAAFDLTAGYIHPDVMLLSLSPFDLFPSSLKTAFTVPKHSTGGLRKGFSDIYRIADRLTYKKERQRDFECHHKDTSLSETKASEILEAVAAMKKLCQNKGIRLEIVLSPYYSGALNDGQKQSFNDFKKELSTVCSYRDYTVNTLCSDRRFFYNLYEFRTALGDMVLADLFDSPEKYVPKNFCMVVQENNTIPDKPRRIPVEQLDLPVLLYHHITEETGFGDSTISVTRFKEHMAALKAAGYQTVSLNDIENYVLYGKDLPKKPILITFDDGYTSNYELAYPVLKENDMKAAIFVIGWAIGNDRYKDTEHPMIPHFDDEVIKEMTASGLIEIQSHTYDLHQSELLEKDTSYRYSALPLDSESVSEYRSVLEKDFDLFADALYKQAGISTHALSYPHGLYSPLSEKVFAEKGVLLTFSTEYRYKNTLVKGLPQTLRALCRFTISESMDKKALLNLIDKQY